MKALPDFRLETYFSRWEFRARINLCASDMETTSMRDLLELADDEDRERWDRLRLGYIETFGTPSLRAAIAETYDTLAPECVLAFAGAEEGIFAAMRALLDRDDHAVVITPNYQSAESLPAAICETTGVPLDYDGGWRLDIDRLFAAVRPETRLISVNFPHNPTGHLISAVDFEAIIEFARQRGIYLFSDEVYRQLEHDPTMRLQQAADAYERGLSLNVLSKAYGLAGLRIGWIATRDRKLLERMERIKHYLSICNSAPSEVLGCIALRARDRILERSRRLLSENLPVVTDFFRAHEDLFEWTSPSAGCIAYPRYLGDDGVESFCEGLVNEAGVLLLPASVYRSALGPTPVDHFRIGFGRADLRQGLDALNGHLERSRTR